jgi:Na+/phosphate symporter
MAWWVMNDDDMTGVRAGQRAAVGVSLHAGWLLRIVCAVAGLLVFILALNLLKEGARDYGRAMVALFNVTSPVSALGFGWLLAYMFLSGSPVAAIAIAFFAAGTLDALQTFTMITGSRLGASLIVLVVGFFYYLRGHRRAASVAIGVLALLTTAAIYLPAMALGYWALTSGFVQTIPADADAPLTSVLDWMYEPIMNAINALGFPGWAKFGAGVVALLTAFALLDRALPQVEPESNAFSRIGRLVYRPMVMFALGMAVTSVTMSVSVSLSILVPLSVRGLVRRENTLPYIMGANITTFIDTLVAALIVGGAAAFTIVLVEMVSVAILSLIVILFFYHAFQRSILRLQDAIVRHRRTLAAFLVVMFIIPVMLLAF